MPVVDRNLAIRLFAPYVEILMRSKSESAPNFPVSDALSVPDYQPMGFNVWLVNSNLFHSNFFGVAAFYSHSSTLIAE